MLSENEKLEKWQNKLQQKINKWCSLKNLWSATNGIKIERLERTKQKIKKAW